MRYIPIFTISTNRYSLLKGAIWILHHNTNYDQLSMTAVSYSKTAAFKLEADRNSRFNRKTLTAKRSTALEMRNSTNTKNNAFSMQPNYCSKTVILL